MGSGGYRSAIPRWERIEADLLAKGIPPFSIDWPERSKYWFFMHGGKLDPETGEAVVGETIRRVAQRLFDIIDASASGAFVPNQEKDELTYALQIPKHLRQTRGKGLISWRHGFPEDAATYRSRQQRKDEEAERIHRLEEVVLQSRE